MEESNSNVVIDIKMLENSMKDKLDLHGKLNDTAKNSETIISNNAFEHHVYEVYKNNYEPVVVSIGPYHHGKRSIRAMEKKKWNCLEYILKANNEKTLDNYFELLGKIYPLARTYYAEELEIDKKGFVQMLLLDACFILVFLYPEWKFAEQNEEQEENPNVEVDPLEYCFVSQDLLLANNQIPFYVLKRIYELFTNQENADISLFDKAGIFIENFLFGYPIAIKEFERPKDFHHFLHLCHLYSRPTQRHDYSTIQMDHANQSLSEWHRALQYHIAGIQFAKREFDENNPHSLLDVRFNDNVIEIPRIPIDENTKEIFRNYIALEKTSTQFGNDVTSYIIFISQLIGNSEDLVFLVSKGIIEHHFERDEEVLDIFMELSGGIIFDFASNYYLKNIFTTLEEYCQSRMKSWKGWIRHTGFAIRGWV